MPKKSETSENLEERPKLPAVLHYTPDLEEIKAIQYIQKLIANEGQNREQLTLHYGKDFLNLLKDALQKKQVLLLEYLLLPKDQWAVLGSYLKKDAKKEGGVELELSEFICRDDLFFDWKNSLEKEGSSLEQVLAQLKEQLKTAAEKKAAKQEKFSIFLSIQAMNHAIKDQSSRDQTRYIAKSVASVSGVIIGAAIGTLLIPIPGLGTAIGAAVGGFFAWKGFGYLLGTGTAKVAPEKLAMASGVDWGTIIGAAIGTALLPGLGTAIGAAIGCVVGGVGSSQAAKRIRHKTSKVVTNIAAALGGIVGGFIGAALGTLVFPGIGSAAGLAIGAAAGIALLGGGTFLRFKLEKTENPALDAPRKMAAAGGIAGATAGAGIGALIGSMFFPGVGTVVGAAIGAVAGMLGVGGASYAATKKSRGLVFSAGAGAVSGAAIGAAIGTVIFPGIGTAIGAGIGFLLGAASGVAIKKSAVKWSKESVVMGVTGAVGGAKIGGQVGTGIGGFLGLLIGGPPGLVVGAAIGGAIGALVGAITFGLGRALLGRFTKKTSPESKQSEKSATTSEATVSDAPHPSPSPSIKFEEHKHEDRQPVVFVKHTYASEHAINAAVAAEASKLFHSQEKQVADLRSEDDANRAPTGPDNPPHP